jgi:hypothetical protein
MIAYKNGSLSLLQRQILLSFQVNLFHVGNHGPSKGPFEKGVKASHFG